MKLLSEIINTLIKNGYLTLKIEKNTISDANFPLLGQNLMQNIKNLWFNEQLVPTFIDKNNEKILKSTYDFCLNNSLLNLKKDYFIKNYLNMKNSYELPFCLKEIQIYDNYDNRNGKNKMSLHDLCFSFTKKAILSSTYFISELSDIEYFYKIQRERKIWWMKHSFNPARYYLCEYKNEIVKKKFKHQSVEIKSKFDFGDWYFESINGFPLKAIDIDMKEYYIKDLRTNKKIMPYIVQSKFCLEEVTLGLLMDSIVDNNTGQMKLNCKIAPYQIAIFCSSSDGLILKELQNLATHISNILQKANVSIKNIDNNCISDENNQKLYQLTHIDCIGVPYAIILDKDSLKNGLMSLRNRDTTLSETIHISDIPSYLMKIFSA